VRYVALNALFLAVAALGTVAAVAVTRRATADGRPGQATPTWRALAATGVVMLALTAVFDNVIIGVGLVDYHPERHLGLRLGLAPVEDFAYTVAALALLPALWCALHREETA